MVERIGRDSALAREAVQAAIKQAAERISSDLASGVEAAGKGASSVTPVGTSAGVPPADAGGIDFAQALESGIRRVDQQVDTAESMPIDLLTGKIDDFHQIAVQLKSAELSFKFAMEIRNKLVDAYREVMRMSV